MLKLLLCTYVIGRYSWTLLHCVLNSVSYFILTLIHNNGLHVTFCNYFLITSLVTTSPVTHVTQSKKGKVKKETKK